MLEISGLPSRYILKKKLGAGGMSVVYLVFDQERGVDIALKKLQVEVTSQFGQAFNRFKREFELLASLSHPNLIKTYELQQTGQGEPFLTMEYVQGTPLDELVEKGELTFDQKLSIALQVARALEFIHSKGIIHRDVKPSNIIVQENLQVKLLDFGLSRYIEEENSLTISTELIGSPQYVSPEYINRNFQKDPPDHRADIYSFGATIFELFTGHPPFHHSRSWEILGSHLCHPPPRLREIDPTLPAWLDTMLNICLNKKSEYRYQGMGEVVELVGAAGSPFQIVRGLIAGRGYAKTHVREHFQDIKSRYAHVLAQVFFSLLLAYVAVSVWGTQLGIKLDQAQLRKTITLRGPIDPSDEVVIIALNDATVSSLALSPRQPFPRKYFAEALERIIAAKPRLIVLDFTGFQESDDEEANLRIERALAGPVPITIIKGLRHPSGNIDLGDERFRKAAAMELSMLVDAQAETVWRVGLGSNPIGDEDPVFPLKVPLERFAGKRLQRPDPRSLINFYGPPMHLPSYPLYQFMGDSNEYFLAQIRDRIVFIGMQNSSNKGKGTVEVERDDFLTTASSDRMFGVEIHATIASNFIDGTWIRRASKSHEQLSILCIVFTICLVSIALPAKWGLPAAIAIVLSWGALSYTSVTRWQFFIPGAALGAIILLALIVAVIVIQLIRSRKVTHDLKSAFGLVKKERT